MNIIIQVTTSSVDYCINIINYDKIIAMEKVFIAIIFILIIICIISIIDCYRNIDINYFNIKSDKIDKNIKILFLSDLHNRNLHKKLKEIINNIKPDIIICGGDMVNNGIHKSKNFLKLIPLLELYKTYYTFGNHEEVINEKNPKDYKEYIKYIKRTYIILVNNSKTSLSKNIKLYGLNQKIDLYSKCGKLCLDKKIVEDYIGKLNKKNFNILVAHNPLEFDSYKDYGADLVLSGHVHGGMIKLPLLGALLSPDYTFFPKYYEGEYKKDNTTMIVSRGLGFSKKIPFRINNRADVVVVNLKKK